MEKKFTVNSFVNEETGASITRNEARGMFVANILLFVDTRLYTSPYRSVGRSVCRSVGRSVCIFQYDQNTVNLKQPFAMAIWQYFHTVYYR